VTAAWSRSTRAVLREVGIDLPPDAGATDLKRQRHLLEQADIILVMTDEQRRMLGSFPEAAGKPVDGPRAGGRSGDIADPAMQDEDFFRRCRDEITRCLARGLERLLAPDPMLGFFRKTPKLSADFWPSRAIAARALARDRRRGRAHPPQ
jgi:protein-tyrosine-phosphatase